MNVIYLVRIYLAPKSTADSDCQYGQFETTTIDNEYCFNVVNCFRVPKIYPVREVSEGGDVHCLVRHLGAGAGGRLPLALRRGEAQHQVPGKHIHQ